MEKEYNNNQKGFKNLIFIGIFIVLIAVGGYLALRQRTPADIVEEKNLTFSDKTHISFEYLTDWKVGQFGHSPGQFNLQPADKFISEATKDDIFISVSGHCMNTQCLTVFSLDDMVREFDAKVIKTANAKNVAGYKVSFPNGQGGILTGYMFLKGDDFVMVSTDIYESEMDAIIPTLELLASTSPRESTVKIGKVSIDSKSVKELQSLFDDGHQPWRGDPESVAEVAIYPDGLAKTNAVSELSLDSEKGVAVYLMSFEGRQYEVTVMQPVVGKNKIWVVSDIEYSLN